MPRVLVNHIALKKRAALVAGLLAIACLAVAQPKKQWYALGIKAGTTFSIARLGDPDDKAEFSNSWKTGYFGAAVINFQLPNNYSLQNEFGFAQRGRKVEFNENTWLNDASYQFLEGSMLLRRSFRLKWSKNVEGTWYVNVGPRISYWMGGKGTVTSGGSYDYTLVFAEIPESTDEPDFDKMYMQDANRWLFGIDFGIGLEAPTRAMQRFMFEFRFTSGHTYLGAKDGAFNRTLGFTDNLRANEKIISLSIEYALTRRVNQNKQGKSTNSKPNDKKPRKNFDSMIR